MRLLGSAKGRLPGTEGLVAVWAQLKTEGVSAIWGSDGLASYTDNGIGDFTLTWSRAFRSASSYVPLLMCTGNQASLQLLQNQTWTAVAAGSAQTELRDFNGSLIVDPDMTFVVCFGEY